MRQRHLCLQAVILATFACASWPATRTATTTRVFGPVVTSDEAIAGRTTLGTGDVLLLIPRVGLVDVDLGGHRSVRHLLPPDFAELCWGLGQMSDGSIWVLKNMQTLARVNEAAAVLNEIPLSAPHLGLFANGNRLLFMKATPQGAQPVLESGLPGNGDRQPWSMLRTRTFALSKAASAALNMVGCGDSRTNERPCWFPEETGVSLIDSKGSTRRIDLVGIDHVAAAALLDHPNRPIRDVYVDATGALWVIGTGRPPKTAGDVRGGWLFAKYRNTGDLIFVERLPAAARLILRADEEGALLLGGDGYVLEVHP